MAIRGSHSLNQHYRELLNCFAPESTSMNHYGDAEDVSAKKHPLPAPIPHHINPISKNTNVGILVHPLKYSLSPCSAKQELYQLDRDSIQNGNLWLAGFPT
eukprot:scaffold69957_cov25-Attheya_sp.AAC.1